MALIQPDEERRAFQAGLRRFSYRLLNVASPAARRAGLGDPRGRSVVDTASIALAIAMGITPRPPPDVVSTSLAAVARRLSAMPILVKRIVLA